MIFRKPLRRASRLLAALLVVLGMAAAITTVTTQHAFAATCGVESTDGLGTEYLAHGLTCDNVPLSHVCTVMGGNGGVNAIECTDLYISYTPGGYDVYGVGEYYCQSTAGYSQCAAMSVDQAMYNTLGGVYGHPGGNYTCTGSSCATQRALVDTYHDTGSAVITSGYCLPFSSYVESISSNTITVPDGDPISGASVGTPFVQVCFT